MKLISHEIFLKHDLKGHPENADRIRKALKEFEYEQAEDGEKYLNKVHTNRYIQAVKKASEESSGTPVFLDAGETYVVKETYKAACYAVGAAVAAADYALNKQPAFALVRPPGHHAHPDWTNGFCIFNNIAIAAAYLAEKGNKVLIIDIDMHRGDGTQEIVSKLNSDLNNRLYYFSINQQGVFPGIIFDEGSVKNIYLEPGTSEDDYIKTMKSALEPLIRSFRPKFIAVSAGFDSSAIDKETHSETIGCGLSLTRKTITELKKIIGNIPYFAVLEGGYSPEAVLDGVAAFLGVASNVKPVQKKEAAEPVEENLVLENFLFEEIPVKKRKTKKAAAKPDKKKVKTVMRGKVVRAFSCKEGEKKKPERAKGKHAKKKTKTAKGMVKKAAKKKTKTPKGTVKKAAKKKTKTAKKTLKKKTTKKKTKTPKGTVKKAAKKKTTKKKTKTAKKTLKKK